MVAVAIGATLTGVAVPMSMRAIDSMRLSSATRDVERELQTARLKAVSKNRAMVLRMSCPAVGQYRIVELTGVAATDTDPSRCSESLFPYPGPADTNPATPAFDGPIRYVHPTVSVAGPDLLFRPNGTAALFANGVQTPVGSGAAVTITRSGTTKSVQINGLGKIQIQ
jgi:Tfp pilus assembly protein FimT